MESQTLLTSAVNEVQTRISAMSFGFSIGDIIAVSHLANKVRKRLVDSSDQFKAVSDK